LHKKKETIRAVDNVSFDVFEGELFGLVGPNGAGKTTTVKVLCTLLTPTSGNVKVLGYDVMKEPEKIRPKINVVFGGERGLYWRLSGKDNLRYFAYLYEVNHRDVEKRVEELLTLVGLSERADEKVENYSRGMKQRLHFAKSLINDPQVIFMDEPTQGLDPEIAHALRRLISDLTKEGKTIFLTTHYMLEADELCNRVAVINKGQIAALDSPASLKKYVANHVVIEIEAYGAVQSSLKEIEMIDGVSLVTLETLEQKQLLKVQSESGAIVSNIVEKLGRTNIIDVRIREPTLEDAYLKLVGAG
jgi:ABC-2 type transport system ATP-binding protein